MPSPTRRVWICPECDRLLTNDCHHAVNATMTLQALCHGVPVEHVAVQTRWLCVYQYAEFWIAKATWSVRSSRLILGPGRNPLRKRGRVRRDG